MQWMTMVLLLLATNLEARPLGRLFFTPAERQRLEASIPVPEAPGHRRSAHDRLRFDGWTHDASGRAWFWIAGRPYTAGRPPFRPRRQGAVAVLSWHGRQVRLRPGQAARFDGGRIQVEEAGR